MNIKGDYLGGPTGKGRVKEEGDWRQIRPKYNV
jgi:hypothetical protein